MDMLAYYLVWGLSPPLVLEESYLVLTQSTVSPHLGLYQWDVVAYQKAATYGLPRVRCDCVEWN